jgi:hypothetical protein
LTLGFVVLSVEFAMAQRRVADSFHCVDFMCAGDVQIGGVREIGVAFLLGFAGAFWLFLRGRRLTGA